ncbi:MAG: MASE1 domain-containing protein [Vicinamibacterales bacterium]
MPGRLGTAPFTNETETRDHTLRTVTIGAAVAAAYVIAALIGFRLAFAAEQITTVWAPTGIAIAALLLAGPRLWPAVWCGAFLANATTSAPLWTAAVIATGNTLEPVLAVWLLRRTPAVDPPLSRVADVLRFLLFAALLCTAVSATTGVTTLVAAGAQPSSRFATLWFEWWIGDLLGAVIVAPAILAVARYPWPRRDIARATAFVLASALVAHLTFGQLLGVRAHPLEYALFPLVIGAAATSGPAVTSLVVASASAVALWHTVQGGGPFASPQVRDGLILLQVFMGVLAGTALLLAAAVIERKRLEEELRHHATEVERILQSIGEGFVAFDHELRYVYVNQPAERMLSRARGALLGRHPWDVFPPEAVPITREQLHAAATSGTVTHLQVHVPSGDRWFEHRVYPSATGVSVFFNDVSHRVAAEAALQQATAAAEERQHQLATANRELARRVLEQQTLFDVLPIGIGIALDRECRHITTNRAFAATLGLTPAQNASKTAVPVERPTNFRVFTSDGVEVPDDQLPLQVAARDGAEVSGLELDVVHDDGRVVRLLEYAAPLMDERGIPRGAVGAFVDVTAAHEVRATLARSEERYRQIFESAGVSLWEQDFRLVAAALDGVRATGVEDLQAYLDEHPEFVDRCMTLIKVVDVNQATVRLFAAGSKSELLLSLDRILGPEARDVLSGELVALAEGRRVYETEAAVRTLDGRRLHTLVSVTFPEPGQSLDRVLVSVADITARKQAEIALRQEVEIRSTLANVGAALAGELQSDRLIQAVTDASTRLTEAELGAFVYNATDDDGHAFALYSVSGAAREALDSWPPPRRAETLVWTPGATAIVRVDDITDRPPHGILAPFRGAEDGDAPVRSYLAVPVIGRGGAVLGGLFFGHSRPGVFTERHELLAGGVAGWAAIALDNARLYQEAAEANRLKDEFLATLSHELRTPLNAVLGWAHMLREGTLQDPMRRRALESIERNARAQAQLVEDLLDVSRIVAGKLQLKTEAVDLASVIAHAVDTVHAGVTAKRLTLQVHVPRDQRIFVTGDADRLQQVVWNLVSNAVKFTPAGGRVDIELSRIEAKAAIVVRDTGQGIDPSFRPHLFQRFRQMDASKTRVHGGLGLGLSIVRHLVEAHGGTVTADSDGLDRGSRFCVELPLRTTAPRADGVVADVNAGSRSLDGVRVMVVDDDTDAREVNRYVLERCGAFVAATASAGEALHLLAAGRYDVLVADISLREHEGLALVRALRSLPAGALNREIPAIGVADDDGHESGDAPTSGFTLHLRKPVDPDQLIAAVSASVLPLDPQP